MKGDDENSSMLAKNGNEKMLGAGEMISCLAIPEMIILIGQMKKMKWTVEMITTDTMDIAIYGTWHYQPVIS